MTITLITVEEFTELANIQERSKILTFQNDGFEYIDHKKFTESDEKDYQRVIEILRKSILGFRKFHNFRLSKDGTVQIRFDYNWTADDEKNSLPFTGVGYLDLIELLEGFHERV